MSHREILESELREFQIELSINQKTKLARYCDELRHWNEKINLTGLTGQDLVRRLVVEPVWIARQLMPTGGLVDIGSGNGSPAIPMHVVSGFGGCHLVEARTKRAVFLRHVAATLRLPELKIHRARFEDVLGQMGRPDWITLQAVSLTDELVESIRRVCSSTTTIVWITASGASPPLQPTRSFNIPITGTQVLLFRLDLS